MTEFNDFGFAAIDEADIPTAATQIVAREESDRRLKNMYDAITPLLANLKSNPDKDTILWPNRKESVEKFEKKLLDILEGT